ncbi:hypothetical protein NBRC116598_41340 [Pseudophaeobacter arcticus]|jgi:hypothetical protein|uniref:Uncharacterized protein n=1 Tax=Pseudophaeobacter arcticus TaxID=385492 RepID=A0ABQ0AS71_9RHOB
MAAFSFLTHASRSCGEWPEPAPRVVSQGDAAPSANAVNGMSAVIRNLDGSSLATQPPATSALR